MSEGPYRDLGSGFARLTGVEGVRRAPSHVRTVEDALLELARNAVDAGASNVYVASALHSRRYRELVVLDDGRGVPEPYRERIFEPGVTTRHLAPSRLADRPHGAGLSLHHIREAALSATLLSTASPTSVRAVFDTASLPERALQSAGRSRHAPRTNLRAALQTLSEAAGAPAIFYGSPASILALLIDKRIIPKRSGDLERWCAEVMGVELSRRTLQRAVKGQVSPAERVGEAERPEAAGGRTERRSGEVELAGGAKLVLDGRDLAEIRAVIERAARESYMEIGEISSGSREGEVTIRAEIYEAEGEYDE